MSDRLRSQIEFECAQLELLLRHYGSLFIRSATTRPDASETAAIGAVLQSFYNGVENVFKRIAIEVDGQLPRGEFWHKELLDRMARPEGIQPAIISAGLHERLKQYLHFRHIFRSAYVLVLRWEKMAPLAGEVSDTLRWLKSELSEFLRQIERRGGE